VNKRRFYIISGIVVLCALLFVIFQVRGRNVRMAAHEDAVMLEPEVQTDTTEEEEPAEYVEAEELRKSSIDKNAKLASMEYYDGDRLMQIDRFEGEMAGHVFNNSTEMFPTNTDYIYTDGMSFNGIRYEYETDNNGDITKLRTYRNVAEDEEEPDFVLEEMTEYEYFAPGRPYKEMHYQADANGKKEPTGFYVYIYDQNNVLSERRYYEGSALQMYEKYQCNTNGDAVRVDRYRFDDTLIGYYLNTYRDDGQLLSVEMYGYAEDNFCSISYEYDSKDYMRKQMVTNHDYDYMEEKPVDFVTTIIYKYADESKLGEF